MSWALYQELVQPGAGLRIWERIIHRSWPSYLARLSLVVLVLLIACANIAILMLARSAVRGGEMDTRMATQLLTGSAVLAAAGVAGLLAAMWEAREAREQAWRAERREAITSALYLFSQSLIGTSRLEQIAETAGQHIVDLFGCRVVVMLPTRGELTVYFSSPRYFFDEGEKRAATWVFRHARKAGRGTELLAAARGYYLPLETAFGVKGVLGVEPEHEASWLTAEQHQVLDIFAGRAASAIEAAVLEGQAQQARLLEETDRLQKALLNTVSHNLRTPLASITGTLGTLLEDLAVLDDHTRNELLENAYDQSTHLNRLVGNLLDMTRLEAGTIHLKTELSDVQDLAGAALNQLGGRAARREIVTDIPPDLPLVPMDFVLIVQTLVNLLDNALKYAPPDEPIEIAARVSGGYLELSVSDRGPGITEADLEHVFDKFNRGGRGGQAGGFGLGLSICKGFVEAHGGRIRAAARAGGGTEVTFTLPLKGSDEHNRTIHSRS